MGIDRIDYRNFIGKKWTCQSGIGVEIMYAYRTKINFVNYDYLIKLKNRKHGKN